MKIILPKMTHSRNDERRTYANQIIIRFSQRIHILLVFSLRTQRQIYIIILYINARLCVCMYVQNSYADRSSHVIQIWHGHQSAARPDEVHIFEPSGSRGWAFSGGQKVVQNFKFNCFQFLNCPFW